MRSEGIANWNTQFDGTAGGVIGWALGNLALNLLGVVGPAPLRHPGHCRAGFARALHPLIYAAAAVKDGCCRSSRQLPAAWPG